MKNLFSATDRPIKTFMNARANYSKWRTQPVISMIILFTVFLFTACKKYETGKPQTNSEAQLPENNVVKTDLELLNHYNDLDPQTLWELRQVRAATAKYQNINNAFGNSYVDIGLVMQNMGYHFLKAQLVSPVFDLKKPPILVYNKKDNGNFELVAVEYAVPIDPQSPGTPPEGFSGNNDEWDFNTLNTG